MPAPHRIVSLLSAATDIVVALGRAAELVAIGHECDEPSPGRHLPRVTRSRVDSSADSGAIDRQVKALLASGESLYELDAATIRALRPTVILTQAQCPVCAVSESDVRALVATVPSLAAARIVTLLPHALADVERDVARTADALGAQDSANAFLHDWHARIDAVRRRVGDRPKRRVALIEWTDPIMLAGNWLPELLEIAGGGCPFTWAGEHSPYVAWETIRDWKPEVVIVAPCGFDLERAKSSLNELRHLSGFADLGAAFYCADGDKYFNRSGPRLLETLEALEAMLWPRVSHDGTNMFEAVRL
ncbi:MAG: ABC transporter substrate-binding protein [Pirellulales bacterium]